MRKWQRFGQRDLIRAIVSAAATSRSEGSVPGRDWETEGLAFPILFRRKTFWVLEKTALRRKR